MRLRYQMRGLGIGIFVTALLMGVATKEGRPLTDAEIRAKAYELGMVDGDSVRLTDIKGGTPNPQGTMSPQGTIPPQGAADPGGAADGDTDVSRGTAAPGDTASGGVQPPQGTSGSDAPVEPVTVVIMRGAHSYSVSVQLAEAGLIEDASEFDTYLCENGYAERVRAGTYKLIPGTGMEQLARIITGTR